jgi:hypothetical protein
LPAAAAIGGAIGHTPALTGNAHPPVPPAAVGLALPLGPATGRTDGDGEADPDPDGDDPDPDGDPGPSAGAPMTGSLPGPPRDTSVMTPALAARKRTTPIGANVQAHRSLRREGRAGGTGGITTAVVLCRLMGPPISSLEGWANWAQPRLP